MLVVGQLAAGLSPDQVAEEYGIRRDDQRFCRDEPFKSHRPSCFGEYAAPWTSFGLLSAASLRHVSAEWRFWKKVRFVFILYAASLIGGVLIGSPLHGALGDGAVATIKVLTTAAFGLLLLRMAQTRNIFLLLTVIESANLANTLNLVTYPLVNRVGGFAR